MKRFSNTTYWLFFIILSGIGVGCGQNGRESAGPAAACRVQKYTAISQSNSSVTNQQTTYEYDPQGNLLTTNSTSDKRFGSATVQTGTVANAYTYDADGYLTASTSQELYVTIASPTSTLREQTTTTKSYSYASGRLAGYMTKRVGAYGLTYTTTDSFVYDQGGQLLTKTEQTITVVHDPALAKEIPQSPTGPLRIWTYNANRLVDYVERSTNSEQRPFTIQNGVVSRVTGPNYEVRFEYDGQQRVTRQENYVDGRLTDYYTRTWNEAKSATSSLPLFKGFPASEISTQSVLSTYKSFRLNQVSGEMQQLNDDSNTVQTNAQGFVTGATLRSAYPMATSQNYTTTESYTYIGCP